MHVTIRAESRRGLRIIEEIPDIGLCKIEGYNGIGKTSAIRLLQLCTGADPFSGNDLAWRTFCEELTSATVRVKNLIGAEEVEWVLRPSQWSATQRERAEPLAEGMVKVRINGQDVGMGDVRPLLRVHHLNVTETPVEILRARAESAQNVLDAWRMGQGDPRANSIDAPLFSLVRMLNSIPTDQVRLAFSVAQRTQAEAEEVAVRAALIRDRVKILAMAVETAEHLETVQGVSPRLEDKLTQLEQELQQVDGRKVQLNEQIDITHANKDVNERAERKFASAQRSLSRWGNAQRKAADTLKQAAAAVGVPPHRGRVAEERVAAERKLAELIKAQPYVNAAPMLMSVLDALLKSLDAAIASDLGAKLLLDADDRQPGWTVAGLRDACRQQQMKLTEADQGGNADHLAADIDATRTRLDSLGSIDQLLNAAESAEAKLRDAEAALVQAATDLPGESAGRFNDLVQERNACDQRGRELQSEIDRLRSERDLIGGGKTEETLIVEFDQLCRQVGVEPSRIRGAYDRAREQSNALNKEETQAAVRAASANRETDERLIALSRVVTELATSSDLEWLRRAAPWVAELPGQDLNGQVVGLERLRRRMDRSRDVIEGTKGAVQSISAALAQLATRLRRPESPVGSDQLWTKPVAQWLAEEARRWFDDEIMRQAMFDGGKDIRFDSRNLSISWRANGEFYQRPLSAFSSGEQAFAHTRAQLAQLERDDGEVANRLIALDEFGAFLDGRSIAHLTSYLIKRRDRMPQDQVLVILPSDLAQETVPEDESGTSRSAQLALRGYYTEALIHGHD